MKAFTLLFLSLSFFNLYATTTKEAKETKETNCTVDMKTTSKKGEIKSLTKKYKVESKKECDNIAKIYSENFAPDFIEKVEVKVHYN